MTPTRDEIARTISLEIWGCDYTPMVASHPDERWVQATAAATAVIKTHIVPMVAEAYAKGSAKDPPMLNTIYAARIEREILGTAAAKETK